MKTSELTGALLDYWVARAVGVDAVMSDPYPDGSVACVTFYARDEDGRMYGRSYCPSSHWSDGGPLIEREMIEIVCTLNCPIVWRADAWRSTHDDDDCPGKGPTPLIAAMRALVAAKFGKETPDEVKQ